MQQAKEIQANERQAVILLAAAGFMEIVCLNTRASLQELSAHERGRLDNFVAADISMFLNGVIPLHEIAGGVSMRLLDIEDAAELLPAEVSVVVN